MSATNQATKGSSVPWQEVEIIANTIHHNGMASVVATGKASHGIRVLTEEVSEPLWQGSQQRWKESQADLGKDVNQLALAFVAPLFARVSMRLGCTSTAIATPHNMRLSSSQGDLQSLPAYLQTKHH